MFIDFLNISVQNMSKDKFAKGTMMRLYKIFYFAFTVGLLSVSAVCASQNDGGRLIQIQNQLAQMGEQIKLLEKEVSELQQAKQAPLKTGNHSGEVLNPYTKEAHSPSGQANPDPIDVAAPMVLGGGAQQSDSNSQDLYSSAITLLKEHRFKEAEDSLNQFIKNFPNDPMIINAYYWRAETYYIQGDYSKAALLFGEAYEAYLRQKTASVVTQESSKAPEIMLKLASSLASIGKYKDSQVVLQEMDKEFKTIPGNIQQQATLLRREVARHLT